MKITVNGTRLWFDVAGAELVSDGPALRRRPTVVLVHGGPGSYDHSYFKPHFLRLAAHAQVVFLDLRNHGRSDRHDAAQWRFETCADDLRAFCDALGIERPLVFGHSMGGFVVMLYGARHPGHAGALILQSTMARFDLERLVDAFRSVGGDEISELARSHYSGSPVTDEQWARVFSAFGPTVPSADELGRRIRNPAVATIGMRLLLELDLLDQLGTVASPTLVCVGRRDPVTPEAAARQILHALPPGLGRLELIEEAGHFPWLDRPDDYWARIVSFLDEQPVQLPA